jgi:hypothetical protein
MGHVAAHKTVLLVIPEGVLVQVLQEDCPALQHSETTLCCTKKAAIVCAAARHMARNALSMLQKLHMIIDNCEIRHSNLRREHARLTS